ncbi:hypothetical protein R1sor_018130 [Riccia sorocarpa]|uniref:1-phosphatidylinositol 4-kinase n=1 Tax=Riccia sorocarpa TaxID=122646 RepID=A0ABD3I8T1_9MARC
MPPHVRSPVQIQTPVAVPDGTHFKGTGPSGGHSQMLSLGGRQVGRRRIYVQIDTGNVCPIELDRADQAGTVKKKVQEKLGVPTEQSALVFGDHILEKDLSGVRNDSPLLLTRGLQRSSSTPCLCLTPTGRDKERSFEILGSHRFLRPNLKSLLKEMVKAIEGGVQPEMAKGGLGGAYYFRNRKGERVAIVKPNDEEPFAPNNPKGYVGRKLGVPGLKRSIRVGETGVREVAAYLLDHEHFANVPATMMVKASHPIFNVNSKSPVRKEVADANYVAKLCSFQQYAQHDYDASEHGTSAFPVSQVHRIGILDIRILNTDRHAGNILVKKLPSEETLGRLRSFADDSVSLIPIDHGLCLPETFEDPYFEWLHWPQASVPFSEEELNYIDALDPMKDAELLRKELPTLRESSLQILVICTLFLQRGATAGLTLAEIGGMMSRGIHGLDEAESELEEICISAYAALEEEISILSYPVLSPLTLEDDASAEHEHQFVIDDINEIGEPWGCDGSDHYSPFPSPVQLGTGFRSPVSVIGGLNGGFSLNGGLYSFAASPLASPMSPRVPHSCRGKGLTGIPLILENLMEADDCGENPVSPVHTPRSRTRRSPSPPPWENCKPSSSLSGGGYLSRYMSMGQNSTSLNISRNRSQNLTVDRGVFRGTTSASEITRNPNEVHSVVDLPEMNSREWSRFVELFLDMLPVAFTRNKELKDKHRMMTRLGTSCQF